MHQKACKDLDGPAPTINAGVELEQCPTDHVKRILVTNSNW